MTKISIVLPTYNGSRFIKDSINSIIEQTEKDWELIIINDCSTDETLLICEDFARKDARIKVFSNKENLKLPASLNVGFSIAQGKYLTWTSDDNLYKPNALAVMSKYLEEHPEIDFVSADMDWTDEKLQIIGTHSDLCKRNSPITLTYYCNVGACFMYKQELLAKIGEYDITAFLAEDIDYWYRIALNCNIYYLKDNLYLYRTNQFSLTSTKNKDCRNAECYVRNKYAKQIMAKYAKNVFQKTVCSYQIYQKDKFFFDKKPLLVMCMETYVKVLRLLLNLCLIFHPKRKELRAKLIKNLTTV